MKRYELIEHTADIRLQVVGATFKELFEVALEGMAEIIVPDVTKQLVTDQVFIELSALDVTMQLVDFISEALTAAHINNTVYYKVKFDILTEKKLKAVLFGVKVDQFEEDIKAVTYHEVNVKKNEQGNYTTVIVFDI